MHKTILMLAALSSASAAHAATVFVDLGTGSPPEMIGPFARAPYDMALQEALPDGTAVSEIPGSPTLGDLRLSDELTKRTVPTSFPTWSHGYQGPVFLTGPSTTSLTLNLPGFNRSAFYVYVQPALAGAHTITVTANPGTNSSASSGPIAVSGDGGARGFGFYTTDSALFKVTIESDAGAGGFAIADFGVGFQPSDCVLTPIDVGDMINDTWTEDCFSVFLGDETAQYFTFSLAEPTQIQIDLESTAADPLLVLRRGHGLFGQVFAWHDDIDIDTVNLNARLNSLLLPGDYTIEATNLGGVGLFTLRLAVAAAFCALDSQVLCIDDAPGDGRFEVEVEYETVQGGGRAGHGHAIPLAALGVDRGGLFWLFTRANPELLVKVLNGCEVNGRYWVFLTAGTNVGMTVFVRDTVGGFTRVYFNPDLHAALPVQEVTAFPCD